MDGRQRVVDLLHLERDRLLLGGDRLLLRLLLLRDGHKRLHLERDRLLLGLLVLHEGLLVLLVRLVLLVLLALVA